MEGVETRSAFTSRTRVQDASAINGRSICCPLREVHVNHILRVFILLLAISSLSPKLLFAADCGALKTLKLADTTITLAEPVTSASPSVPGTGTSTRGLPAFCRIAGILRPTSDSEIRFELWMPSQGWNGRFLGVWQWRLCRRHRVSAILRLPQARFRGRRLRCRAPRRGDRRQLGLWPPGKGQGLRLARRSPHHRARQADPQRLLRQAPGQSLLRLLLRRRPRSLDGGSALSRRL